MSGETYLIAIEQAPDGVREIATLKRLDGSVICHAIGPDVGRELMRAYPDAIPEHCMIAAGAQLADAFRKFGEAIDLASPVRFAQALGKQIAEAMLAGVFEKEKDREKPFYRKLEHRGGKKRWR